MAVSRKMVYRTGWILYVLSVPSILSVVGLIIQYRRYFPERINGMHFVGLIVLTLALFSNLVLFASRLAWRPVPPRATWSVLLIFFFSLNVILVFFLPNVAQIFGYWLWLAAFALLTFGLVFAPPMEFTRSGRPVPWQPGGADADDAVPGIVWAFLAVTIFWLGVTVVNYYDRQDRRIPVVSASPQSTALTSYLSDPAGVLQAGDQRSLITSLTQFEQATSNQIAVAIYPHLPPEPVEDFTIRVAEASKFGRGNRDNGVILFIFMAERVARIEVGYGLEGALPDAICRRILASELIPQFAQGEYQQGIARTVAAIGTAVEREYGNAGQEGLPAYLKRLYPQLKAGVTKVARNAWPLARDAPLEARMGVSFFGVLLGFGVWSGIANAARLLWSTLMGMWNLIKRRPFKHGMVAVAFEPIYDTVKLAVILAVISGTCVVIAGGGSFGGAGAAVHWTATP
jgi:uncharacterized protein